MLCFAPFIAAFLLFAVSVVALIVIPVLIDARTLPWRQRITVWLKAAGLCAFVIGMGGWIVGHSICLSYGGYASPGKIENGQHYLTNKGSVRAVTAEEFQFVKEIETIFNFYWWNASVAGMAVFMVINLVQRGKVVTALSEGFSELDPPQK